MTWSDVKDVIGAVAPVVGTAIAGSAGGAVGLLVSKVLGCENTPEAVAKAVQTNNPDVLLKLKELENSKELMELNAAIASKKIDADFAVAQSGDVNKTMQSEAASEHWQTYSWRPFIGFIFGVTLLLEVCIVAFLIIWAIVNNHYEALGSLAAIIGAFALLLSTPLPILGVASYFRGKMQADPNIPTVNRG